jgi:hypothetical protein
MPTKSRYTLNLQRRRLGKVQKCAHVTQLGFKPGPMQCSLSTTNICHPGPRKDQEQIPCHKLKQATRGTAEFQPPAALALSVSPVLQSGGWRVEGEYSAPGPQGLAGGCQASEKTQSAAVTIRL